MQLLLPALHTTRSTPADSTSQAIARHVSHICAANRDSLINCSTALPWLSQESSAHLLDRDCQGSGSSSSPLLRACSLLCCCRPAMMSGMREPPEGLTDPESRSPDSFPASSLVGCCLYPGPASASSGSSPLFASASTGVKNKSGWLQLQYHVGELQQEGPCHSYPASVPSSDSLLTLLQAIVRRQASCNHDGRSMEGSCSTGTCQAATPWNTAVGPSTGSPSSPEAVAIPSISR